MRDLACEAGSYAGGSVPRRAYLVVHLARRSGIRTRWVGMQQQLSSWVQLTTTLTTNNGEVITSRQDTRSDTEPVALAQVVGVQPRLHRKQWRSQFPAP